MPAEDTPGQASFDAGHAELHRVVSDEGVGGSDSGDSGGGVGGVGRGVADAKLRRDLVVLQEEDGEQS